MVATFSLFIVPVLAVVVLSMLLLSESRSSKSLGLGMCGILGVLVGGPSAMVMLGAQASETASDVNLLARSDHMIEEVPRGVDREKAASRREENAKPPVRDNASRHRVEIASKKWVKITKPSDRPEWAMSLPVRAGTIHSNSVLAGPFEDSRECNFELDKKLKAATDEYVDWWFKEKLLESDNSIENWMINRMLRDGASAHFDVDLTFIKAHLCAPEHIFQEMRDFSFGEDRSVLMYTIHAKLEFDEAFREELDERWAAVRADLKEKRRVATIRFRLLRTGLFMGGAICLLVVLFGYFQADTATRGYYTGRLQFVAIAMILALIAAGVLVARWIPWM